MDALECIVGIERIPEACVICCEVRCLDYCVVAVEVSNEADCGYGVVSHEGVIEGRELSSVK